MFSTAFVCLFGDRTPTKTT